MCFNNILFMILKKTRAKCFNIFLKPKWTTHIAKFHRIAMQLTHFLIKKWVVTNSNDSKKTKDCRKLHQYRRTKRTLTVVVIILTDGWEIHTISPGSLQDMNVAKKFLSLGYEHTSMCTSFPSTTWVPTFDTLGLWDSESAELKTMKNIHFLRTL